MQMINYIKRIVISLLTSAYTYLVGAYGELRVIYVYYCTFTGTKNSD